MNGKNDPFTSKALQLSNDSKNLMIFSLIKLNPP